MSLILESLEFLIESESFTRIYDEIKQKIANSDVGTEEGGVATNSWLAGMLASRGASEGKLARLVSALDNGQLERDSKEYRDAVRTKIAFETLYKYGLVKQDPRSGRYTFPSSSPADARKRALLSKFRDFMSKGFNEDKLRSDTKKFALDQRQEVSSEWANSLSPSRKKMLDAYTNLSVPAFRMLRSLLSVRGPDGIAEFRKRMQRAKFSEATEIYLLQELGFVTSGYLLNRGFVNNFGSFIKDPDGSGADNAFARLMPFNPELTKFIKDTSAAQARARNAAGKAPSPTGFEDEDEALPTDEPQTKDEMGDEEERAMYSRISQRDGGAKQRTGTERLGDQKRIFSDTLQKAFDR